MFHASNTEEEVAYLAEKLCDFAMEMIEIEESGDRSRLPRAAQQVYAIIQSNN